MATKKDDSIKKTNENNKSKRVNNAVDKEKKEKTVTVKNKKPNNVNKKTVDIKVVDKKIKEKIEKLDKSESVQVNISNKEKEQLNFSLFEVILLIIITILTCILIGYFVVPDKSSSNITNNEITDDNIKNFIEQYNYILDNYYGDINKEQLINDAIEGMLSSLDDYSQVIGQESNSFTITLQGEYEGVGIAITNDIYGNIVIQEVYDKTPAHKAGLKVNDIIIKFNDVDLANVTTSQLVEMIASNNEMKLMIKREDEEFSVDLRREKIVLESVHSKMLENNIGYIDVDIFALNTREQFEKALYDLEGKGMKSLIIDLRDNTGGHLSTVEEMLCLFLDKSHIIYQTEDKFGIEKVYSKGTEDKKYKIVILQNQLSASASEIMTSTLKEELNSYIIGTTSFGKGTVQTLKDVDDDFQYKFTTKRWLTPKGNWINGVGVKPDLEVILPEEYYQDPSQENDSQLKSAIDYLNS